MLSYIQVPEGNYAGRFNALRCTSCTSMHFDALLNSCTARHFHALLSAAQPRKALPCGTAINCHVRYTRPYPLEVSGVKGTRHWVSNCVFFDLYYVHLVVSVRFRQILRVLGFCYIRPKLRLRGFQASPSRKLGIQEFQKLRR